MTHEAKKAVGHKLTRPRQQLTSSVEPASVSADCDSGTGLRGGAIYAKVQKLLTILNLVTKQTFASIVAVGNEAKCAATHDVRVAL